MSECCCRARELERRIVELEGALKDATTHLVGAASAYRAYARRSNNVTPKAKTDQFFTTRADDFDKAAKRAQFLLGQET
jgi:hypothetical protein